MTTHDDILSGMPGACQVDKTGSLAYTLETSPAHQAGVLIRDERTAEGLAVIGAYRAEPGRGNSCPGSPKTNLKPPGRTGGFSIGEAVWWLQPGFNPPRRGGPGLQQE